MYLSNISLKATQQQQQLYSKHDAKKADQHIQAASCSIFTFHVLMNLQQQQQPGSSSNHGYLHLQLIVSMMTDMHRAGDKRADT